MGILSAQIMRNLGYNELEVQKRLRDRESEQDRKEREISEQKMEEYRKEYARKLEYQKFCEKYKQKLINEWIGTPTGKLFAQSNQTMYDKKIPFDLSKTKIEEFAIPSLNDFKAAFLDVLKKKASKDLIISNSHKSTYASLCNYFMTIDDQFDLNKGICIFSRGKGSGKTTAMEAMSQMRKKYFLGQKAFQVINVLDIIELYVEFGYEGIQKFYTGSWCFDDVGLKQERAHHYGVYANVMEEIFYHRYKNKALTFVTTNLTKKEFTDNYDDRLKSRFHEMFSFHEMAGEDFRIK